MVYTRPTVMEALEGTKGDDERAQHSAMTKAGRKGRDVFGEGLATADAGV